MNPTTMYPGLKNRDCFLVEAYGFIDVWSVELQEPIGSVRRKGDFQRIAKSAGWNPVSEPDWSAIPD